MKGFVGPVLPVGRFLLEFLQIYLIVLQIVVLRSIYSGSLEDEYGVNHEHTF